LIKYYVGLDQSLTSTGVCIINSNSTWNDFNVITTKSLKGVERLKYIGDRIIFLITRGIYKNSKMLVGIESYAYSRFSRSVYGLGELGGVIRYLLSTNNICFEVVNIKTWKKEIIGNGNASKEDIASFVEKQEGKPVSFRLTQDEKDAYCIALYLRRKNGEC